MATFEDASGPGGPERSPGVSRRAFLRLGAWSAVGAWGLGACGDDNGQRAQPATTTDPAAREGAGSSPPPASTASTASATANDATAGGTLVPADFERLGACRLTPTKIAGPTAIAQQLVRRDITEGSAGRPMRLGLRVLGEGCGPVPGAVVEVWHADVAGDYSAVHDTGGRQDEGPGTTFLRGSQPVDADGIAEFLSIVPGWYQTRAVHVHVRVHLADRTILTSQLFFDDDFIRAVNRLTPYAENGLPDTFLAQDGQAGDAVGDGIVFGVAEATTANGPGALALLNLTVPRS